MRGVLGVWDWEEKKGRILPVMVDVRWLEGSDEYRCWGRNEV